MTMRRWMAALTLAVPVTGAALAWAPTAATADTTCYTGCSPTTPPVTPNTGGGGGSDGSSVPAPATTAASGLAFTGADIAEMSALGAGAIAVGGVLVVRSRRRRPA